MFYGLPDVSSSSSSTAAAAATSVMLQAAYALLYGLIHTTPETCNKKPKVGAWPNKFSRIVKNS